LIRYLFVLALIPLFAAAQAPQADEKENAEIRAVIQTYISPDPTKVATAFHPAANLFMSGEQNEIRVIPLSQFLENVAKSAAAGQVRPLASIDFIDRVGNAATARITEISSSARVTDYFSLVRGSASWKIVSKTFNVERNLQAQSPPAASAGHAPGQNLCPSTEIRAFDFLAGDWTTSESPTSNAAPATGFSRTEKILNGCAIWEHRYVERQGKELFDAHVIWGYDITTKRMLLFYVDDASHTQLYEGRQESGSWAFYRERPDADGQPILIQVTYKPTSKGFTQTVKRSKDHGKTWDAGSVVTYEPKR
jgi:hypothetical protein